MRTFYVDSVNGSDAGSGLFEAEAWKSVERANASTFGPGDSLLFKCGGRYEGMLVPRGNGAKGNPVTIGAYESGVVMMKYNEIAIRKEGELAE